MSRTDVRRALWISLALLLLTAAVFAPVRSFGFIGFDDPDYVIRNPHVLSGLSWANVRWAFTADDAANWHPITWISHMTDVQVFGVSAGAHHVTNLVLHATNVLLLFWLLTSLTRSMWRSAFVAALFAVHPLHVESVAWIAERKDVLSTMFALLTIAAFVRYVRSPGWRPYASALVLFALGLMSKPMLVTLPVLLLLLDVWPLERTPRLLEKLPFLALAAASSAITIIVQRRGGAVGDLNELPWAFRLTHPFIAYVSYLAKAVWPTGLAAYYPYPQVLPSVFAVAGALALLIALSIVFGRQARRRPYLITGWLLFLIGLLPVIGFLQVGDQAMADRYTYLPLVGLFVIVAWSVPDQLRSRPAAVRLVPGVAGAIVIVCAVMAHTQVQTWRDAMTLWQHALDVAPKSWRAHAGLADALMAAGRSDEAIDHYAAALRLAPRAASIHNSFGLALTQSGHIDQAAAEYAAAVQLDPGLADAYSNLGAMRAREGRTQEAIANYTTALRLDPNHAMAHNNMAIALATEGKFEEAIAEDTQALQLDPSRSDWHVQIAAFYSRLGRESDVRAHLEKALEIDPDNQIARTALADFIR